MGSPEPGIRERDRLKEMSTQEVLRTYNALVLINSLNLPVDEETIEEFRKEMIVRNAKPIEDKISHIIQRRKRISHREVLQQCSNYANAQDIVDATVSLQCLNVIDIVEEGARGKKVYIWKGEVSEGI